MLKKIAVLLLGLGGNIALSLCSPALATLAGDFPGTSASTLGLIVTISAITILPALFLSSALLMKVERKVLLILGLILAIVGGVGPAIANSVGLILFFRALLGFGTGLMMPIQSTYIAEYPEKERGAMFGLSNTLASIIGAVLVLLVGILAGKNWRLAFVGYAVQLIVLVCVFGGIRSTGALGGGAAAEGEKPKEKLTGYAKGRMVLFCISQFGAMTALVAVSSSMSLYIAEYNLGGSEFSGLVSSIGTIGFAIFAALIPVFLKGLKSWAGFFFLLLGAMGLVIYSIHTPVTVIIGYFLIFTFISMYAAFVSTNITLLIPLPLVALISSISTTCIFAGQFISPYIQSAFASIVGAGSNVDATVFIALAVLVAVMMIINIPFGKKAAAPAAAE